MVRALFFVVKIKFDYSPSGVTFMKYQVANVTPIIQYENNTHTIRIMTT